MERISLRTVNRKEAYPYAAYRSPAKGTQLSSTAFGQLFKGKMVLDFGVDGKESALEKVHIVFQDDSEVIVETNKLGGVYVTYVPPEKDDPRRDPSLPGSD
jgi:hypothetical protein